MSYYCKKCGCPTDDEEADFCTNTCEEAYNDAHETERHKEEVSLEELIMYAEQKVDSDRQLEIAKVLIENDQLLATLGGIHQFLGQGKTSNEILSILEGSADKINKGIIAKSNELNVQSKIKILTKGTN
ncbi:hypothetical protein COB64_02575 [Candidatus Wolfebacteria bacterium]|nr:MAG: hypothetical protein COB64_02575 [Candidatus Wolfebacteria bacterium]